MGRYSVSRWCPTAIAIGIGTPWFWAVAGSVQAAEKPIIMRSSPAPDAGRRPIFAAGNSDSDYEMLEWVTAGRGARFGLLLHHTDAQREWAYGRGSHVGMLDRALDAASE